MMDIWVLDKNFNRTALIDEFESCIWNIKYFDISDFELYLPASCDNMRLLKRGNYIVRDKDIVDECMYNVMCVEKVETKTDVEDGDHMIVTGRDLRSITGRRVIWNQTNLNGRVEVELRRLLTENIINPTISSRKISSVTLGTLKNFTETIKQQVTYDNLMEYVVSVLTTYGIGWRTCLNENRQIKIDFFKGVDRSVNQSDYPHIIFSPYNDNLLTSNYSLDYTKYKNVALVAGEGEGTDRKRTTVDSSCTGLNRYELYVDAKSISTNNGEISDADYIDALKLNGKEKLAENTKVESFDGEIEANNMYIYGVDYDLGDIVTVETLYEITSSPRIIGVIESFSDEGETVIPTFSSWVEELEV